MSVARGEIDQTTLSQQVDHASVGHGVTHDIGLAERMGDRQCRKLLLVDLHVKVTAVGKQNAVLHLFEMAAANNVVGTCQRDEQVAEGSRLVHGHDAIAVHDCLDGLDGVDLGDDDKSAHAFESHGNAAAAPAVARHHRGLAREDQVGGVHDAVKSGLPRAVAVVEQVLAVGIVDVDHGVVEKPLCLTRHEAMNARGGLLTAADEVFAEVAVVAVEQRSEVAAVVNDEVGALRERADQILTVLLVGGTVMGVDLKALGSQCRCHIVLCGKGVTARHVHLGAARAKHLGEIRRFCFQVDGHGNFQTLEGQISLKLLANAVEYRHIRANPLDLVAPRRRKRYIFYVAHGMIPSFFIVSYIIAEKRREVKGRGREKGIKDKL